VNVKKLYLGLVKHDQRFSHVLYYTKNVKFKFKSREQVKQVTTQRQVFKVLSYLLAEGSYSWLINSQLLYLFSGVDKT